MRKFTFRSVGSRCALAVCLLLSSSILTRAQEPRTSPPASAEARTTLDEINYDVQLHLLLAANEAEMRESLPPSLEATVRQLRASLPHTNYRLAGAFLYRVKDNGNLEVKGAGHIRLARNEAATAAPTFYELTLSRLRRGADTSGQQLITIERLRFGLRLPITTGAFRAEGGGQSFPVINYEPTGITTDISLREATPTIIGTLSTGRLDELLVLVLTVRRAATR